MEPAIMTNMELNQECEGLPTPAQYRPDRQCLVELKNGKVSFRQKPLSLEKMSETMQEIVIFRGFMEKRMEENCSPLLSIPDEHLPLIAKMVHESDKTIVSLTKHIRDALQPEELDDDSQVALRKDSPLSLSVIESAILSVADRVNYGVDWAGRYSAPLSIWRWELKGDKLDWLPKLGRDKLEARIAERRQVKSDLRAIIDALPESERGPLLQGARKAKNEELNIVMVNPGPPASDENNGASTSLIAGQANAMTPEPTDEDAELKKGHGRPKKEKVTDLERLAKEMEKAEKKAAKAEKERREKETQKKSRSLMSAFFSKPKVSNEPSVAEPSPSAPGLPNKSDPSSSKSDFERTFKPFVVKKDAIVAPINWFEHRKRDKEVIEIDQDSPSFQHARSPVKQTEEDPAVDSKELLSSYLEAISIDPRHRHSPVGHNSSELKSNPMHCVRNIVSQLSEAEVLGDIPAVRRLQDLLVERSKISAKVLIFHEDTRPGYFGTFTKSSATVGPRSPFAKDAVAFDYSYDSGEEWEEEEEGGDDLMSLDGSDDNVSEVGSELDDWLVDDDNDEVNPGTPVSERGGSPGIPPPLPGPTSASKRKPVLDVEKKGRKKRKVMPLMPFTKGPCWEDEIGTCDYEPFKPFRIQLFNDTRFPIDPFTFVSTPIVQDRTKPTKQVFSVPPVPSHVLQVSNSPIATSSNTDGLLLSAPTQGSLAKRKPIAYVSPKTPFPNALLPFLAEKITSLATGNLTWLIESLYQDLKIHKVKKNSIEAKVREVGEKCPVKKIWIVKDEALRDVAAQHMNTSG